MAHTDRSDLERIPSFTAQIGEPLPGREHWQRCDSCLREIDPEEEGPTRYRHRSCDPPPLPRSAAELIERLRARKNEGSR